MTELFPILGGLAVGAVLGLLRPGSRRLVGALAALALGTAATLVSGEYRLGWEYLLVDIPLVGVSSVVGLLVSRRLRPNSMAG